MEEHLYFWGDRGSYGFLSNFYSCKFRVGEDEFNCSEQFFMKSKQEFFDPENKSLAEAIMSETDPKKIKEYGRRVRFFDEKKWIQVRYQVMVEALKHKFSQPELKLLLLKTRPKILVEASPYDRIWGIGLNPTEAKKVSPDQWIGQNLLGKALMEIRDSY